MRFPSLTFVRGISLVEILATVAAIAVLSTVSGIAVNGVYRSTQHRKVEADVQTLNSAIRLYVANGGSLAGVTNPSEVLTRLKTSRSKGDRRRHAGAASGRLIDPRVTAVTVPEGGWKLRAVYDGSSSRFEVSPSAAGVEFRLDPSLAEAAPTFEDRGPGAVSYAQTSGWVWDHGSTANPGAPAGASNFQTNPNVADSSPADPVSPPDPDPGPGGGTPDPGPPPPPTPPRLPTPSFDKAGGAHPEDDFPLLVTITNLPSSDLADSIYQVGSGPWTPFSGPVEVPMNSHLRAQFVSKDSSAYRDSSEHSAYFYPVPESLSGTVESDFHSPSGGPNLAYEITNNNDRFAHGNPVFILDGEPINSGDPNVLAFTSQAFSDVAPGEKFKLGNFLYHNGSTYYDSHATGVQLRISINLPERGESLAFDLNLDLINTENDPDDPQGSADYVKLTNLSQNIPLQINGVNYRIQLEFGATDSFGFSSQSQFHVYEGATGQGALLGTFLPR